MLDTLLANIAHAVRCNESVVIGGGIFPPDELEQALGDVELLYSITIRPKKFIGEYVVTTKAGKVIYSGDSWIDADIIQDMRKNRIFWKYDYRKKWYILENFKEGKQK